MRMTDRLKKTALGTALLLCVLFFAVFVLFITARADVPTLSVTVDGEAVSYASFYQNEWITLEAAFSAEAKSAEYQWQIYYTDEKNACWIDISTETNSTLQLGYAMVMNLLDEDDMVYVRCQLTADGVLYYSDILQLQVIYIEETEAVIAEKEAEILTEGSVEFVLVEDEDESEISLVSEEETEIELQEGSSVVAVRSAARASLMAVDEEEDEDDQVISGGELVTYTITVQYKYYDQDADDDTSLAYTSYSAVVQPGATLETTVVSPTIVGYSPYMDCQEETFVKEGESYIYTYADADGVKYYVYATDAASYSLTLSNIQEDITITIWYYPEIVTYTVLHYVQNILNDDYVLAYQEIKSGYVGEMTDATDLTQETVDGYAALTEGYIALVPFENQEISSDGSTMIYTYYDRIYYLITFQLDGGRGVDPIYARYQTPISVDEPTRVGYTFAYWNKIYENGEEVYEENAQIPSTMPAYNMAYQAVWNSGTSSYNIIYWIQDPDGDEGDYLYWCHITEEADSGTIITADEIEPDPMDVTDLLSSAPDFYQYSYYSHTDCAEEGISVASDGSTTINVYWDRYIYTLRFVYLLYDGTNYYTYKSTNGTLLGSGRYTVYPDDTSYTLDLSLCSGDEPYDNEQLPSGETSLVACSLGHSDEALSGYTIYYMQICAPYGANIYDYWPVISSWSAWIDFSGIYASDDATYTFCTWGSQNDSGYYASHNNKNILGAYQMMDAQLIIDADDPTTVHYLTAYCAASPTDYFYKIYIEAENQDDTPAGVEDEDYVSFEGVYYIYDKELSYSQYSTNSAANQNIGAFQGYTEVDVEEYPDYATFKISAGTNENNEIIIRFLLNRSSYTLTYMSEGQTVATMSVKFGSSLDSDTYNFTPAYPSTLPEGAYAFGGWYTTQDCLEGTEFDFASTKMPANNLIVYAKWVPKTFNVSVYQTSACENLVVYQNENGQMQALQWLVENDEGLSYGDQLPDTVSASGPDTNLSGNLSTSDGGSGDIRQKWIFVCYAYMKDGVEYAIDLSSFQVTGDVDIYAKWTAVTIVSYEISYVLATVDDEGNIVPSTDDDGNLIYVADSLTGNQNEGANRTFTAKYGTELYDAYKTQYYPLTASHTVLMVSEDDSDVVYYTFYYIYQESVDYTIQYLDADGVAVYESQTKSTTASVITENFVYVEGYVADAFQKTIVLSATASDNIITFYYSTAENSSPYTVYYYYQVWFDEEDIGAYDYAVENEDGSISYYRLFNQVNGTAEVGKSFNVPALTITGYTYSYDEVSTQDAEGQVSTTTSNHEGGSFDVTVTNAYGVQVNVYYSLSLYNYVVYHKDYITGEDIVEPVTKEAAYTSEVTENSYSVSELNAMGIYGYTVDGGTKTTRITITITINEDETNPKVNVITFYYYEDTVTYLYVPMVCNVGEDGAYTNVMLLADANAKVSVESENVQVKSGTALGSSPVYNSSAYTFVGWYLDEACTIAVPEEYLYATVSEDTISLNKTAISESGEVIAAAGDGNDIYRVDETYAGTDAIAQTFYALYAPKVGSLTICRRNQDEDHTFVYTITQLTDADENEVTDGLVITVTIAAGEGSVTVVNLPFGTYSVTQEDDWSWRYSDGTKFIDIAAVSQELYFTQEYSRYWLSGFANLISNIFGTALSTSE